MRSSRRSCRLWIITDARAARYWSGLKWASRRTARTYRTKRAAAAVADRMGLGKATPALWGSVPWKPMIEAELRDDSSPVYAPAVLPEPYDEEGENGAGSPSSLGGRRRSTRFLGEDEGYWVRQINSLSWVFD